MSDTFKGRRHFTQAQISEAYNAGVLNSTVGSFRTWGDIVWYIENFGAQEGVNVSGFNNLSSGRKSTLYTSILNRGSFSSTASFTAYLNAQISGGGGGSPGGGGSGGSGGGGTIGGTAESSPVPTQQDPADVVKFNDRGD